MLLMNTFKNADANKDDSRSTEGSTKVGSTGIRKAFYYIYWVFFAPVHAAVAIYTVLGDLWSSFARAVKNDYCASRDQTYELIHPDKAIPDPSAGRGMGNDWEPEVIEPLTGFKLRYYQFLGVAFIPIHAVIAFYENLGSHAPSFYRELKATYQQQRVDSRDYVPKT